MKLTRRKVIVGLVVLLLLAAGGAWRFWFRAAPGVTVTVEAVQERDLEAIVSASGKIQPKRSVDISADTVGRVTELVVNEGDRVRTGQFLLQVDPRNLRSAVERNEASLGAAEASLRQARESVETARSNLALSQENVKRQRDLWAAQLTTRESLDRAETEVKVRQAEVREREAQIATQEKRIDQERAVVNSSRYDLSKVRIESPIDGIITRRNIELGETVVVGTMNNAGTVLLTIADLSVIEAEIDVDETDIPAVQFGQTAKVTIDAMPNKSFTGKVTEIGNSPVQQQASGQQNPAQTTGQATNFQVVVTLDSEIDGVRPGFTCTADITTATRTKVLSVPIQAMAVREVTYDSAGAIVRLPPPDQQRRSVEPSASAAESKLGETQKEEEGVFVMRDGRAVFLPVSTGIAGEKYFEVLNGLKAGDQVITGPFNSVRDLADGAQVKLEEPKNGRSRFSFGGR